MFQMLGVFAEFEHGIIVGAGSRLAFHVRGARGSGSGVARYPGKLSIASARSWRLARESSKRLKDLGRHRNGASGETRDGGYSILRRAGLGGGGTLASRSSVMGVAP